MGLKIGAVGCGHNSHMGSHRTYRRDVQGRVAAEITERGVVHIPRHLVREILVHAVGEKSDALVWHGSRRVKIHLEDEIRRLDGDALQDVVGVSGIRIAVTVGIGIGVAIGTRRICSLAPRHEVYRKKTAKHHNHDKTENIHSVLLFSFSILIISEQISL